MCPNLACCIFINKSMIQKAPHLWNEVSFLPVSQMIREIYTPENLNPDLAITLNFYGQFPPPFHFLNVLLVNATHLSQQFSWHQWELISLENCSCGLWLELGSQKLSVVLLENVGCEDCTEWHHGVSKSCGGQNCLPDRPGYPVRLFLHVSTSPYLWSSNLLGFPRKSPGVLTL